MNALGIMENELDNPRSLSQLDLSLIGDLSALRNLRPKNQSVDLPNPTIFSNLPVHKLSETTFSSCFIPSETPDDMSFDVGNYLQARVIDLEEEVQQLKAKNEQQEHIIAQQATDLQQLVLELDLQSQINTVMAEQVTILNSTVGEKNNTIENQTSMLKLTRAHCVDDDGDDAGRGHPTTTSLLSLTHLKELLQPNSEPVLYTIRVLSSYNMQHMLKPTEKQSLHTKILLDSWLDYELKNSLIQGFLGMEYASLTPNILKLKHAILTSEKDPIQGKLQLLRNANVWTFCTHQERRIVLHQVLAARFLDNQKKTELCTRYELPLLSQHELSLGCSLSVTPSEAPSESQVLSTILESSKLGVQHKIELLLLAKGEWTRNEYKFQRNVVETAYFKLSGKL